MIGGAVILAFWTIIEGAVSRNFRRVGDTTSARLHRDFALATAVIAAGLVALTWIAR